MNKMEKLGIVTQALKEILDPKNDPLVVAISALFGLGVGTSVTELSVAVNSDDRLLRLTHAEIGMIENALMVVSNKAIELYKTAVDLEKNDILQHNSQRDKYLLERSNRYSDLAGDIMNGEKDV